VFVTGAELSLMGRGFLPGHTLNERVELLTTQPQRLPELVAGASARVNDFLTTATALVRGRFEGKITYASVPLDRVDWTPFDFLSVDLYRSAEVADQFAEGVRATGWVPPTCRRSCRARNAGGDHRVRLRNVPRCR
jgi:hypothetical protein